MLLISIIFLVISSIVALKCALTSIKGYKSAYVVGELIGADLIQNSSSRIYEATYRYKLGGITKLYVSDKHCRNPKHFDDEIKLYYSIDKSHVKEKQSDEILVVSLLTTLLCLVSTCIYTLL